MNEGEVSKQVLLDEEDCKIKGIDFVEFIKRRKKI